MQMNNHRRWPSDESSRTYQRSQRDSLHEINIINFAHRRALPNKAVASPVFNAVDNVYFC